MSKEITPADRLKNVNEYWFSRKLKEIARLNAEGKNIISLGIGGPDMPPPASAIRAAVNCLQQTNSHGYQMTVGLPTLRNAMAKWYEKHYHVENLNPDNEILPLIGSKEGILNIALAFLNPGDGILVPNPGYPTYSSAANLVEAKIFKYELKPELDWQPNFDELEKLPLDEIKLMLVNYPHMPTGTPASIEIFQKLVDFGRQHGILIINDNPYSFIMNSNPLSIFQIEGAKEIAMELNSLSKCLNMAGWRVGMLIGDAKYIDWVLKVKSNIDSGQPKAIMEGAIAALNSEKEWYDALSAEYMQRKIIAKEIMQTLGCECREGQQGLFLWGRIPESVVSAEDFTETILSEKRVFITPGFIFGSAGERYIRISLCAPIEKLKEALNRIKN